MPSVPVSLRACSCRSNRKKSTPPWPRCGSWPGDLASTPHYPGTEEFLTVVKGSLKVRSARKTDVLHSGDSARYQADVKHSIANTSAEEAEAFLVVQFKKE